MVSAIISRVVILLFGTLYPAYASYKAVRTKNVKEYVKWMMYWIVFALFCCVETFSDVFLSWLPFYYELKIVFVIWMLSPLTQGSSFIFKKFVHPQLARREKDIDEMITQASKQGYSTLLSLGTKGVNYASQMVMRTAIMGQSKLVDHLRRSYSTSDLTDDGRSLVQRHEAVSEEEGEDELDNRLIEDNAELDNRSTSSKAKLGRSKSAASSYSLTSVKEEEDLDGGSEEEKVITETFTIPITSRKPLTAKEDYFRAQRLARCQSLPPPFTEKPSSPPLTTTLHTPERKRQSYANRTAKPLDEGDNKTDKKSQPTVASSIQEKRNLFTKSHSQDNVLIQRSKPHIMSGINFQTRKRLLLQRAHSEEPSDRFESVQRSFTCDTVRVEPSMCDVKREREEVVTIEQGVVIREKPISDAATVEDNKTVTTLSQTDVGSTTKDNKKKEILTTRKREKIMTNKKEKDILTTRSDVISKREVKDNEMSTSNTSLCSDTRKSELESNLEPGKKVSKEDESDQDLLIFTKEESPFCPTAVDPSMADNDTVRLVSPFVVEEKDLSDVIIIGTVDAMQLQGEGIAEENIIGQMDVVEIGENVLSEDFRKSVHEHSLPAEVHEFVSSDTLLDIDSDFLNIPVGHICAQGVGESAVGESAVGESAEDTKTSEWDWGQGVEQVESTLPEGAVSLENINTRSFQFKGSKFKDIEEECRSWSTPSSPVSRPKNPSKMYQLDPKLGSWRMELISRRLYASVPDTRPDPFMLPHSLSQDHHRTLSRPPAPQMSGQWTTDRFLSRSHSLDSSRDRQSSFYSPHPMAFAPTSMIRPRAKSVTLERGSSFPMHKFRKLSQDRPSSIKFQNKE